MRFTHFFVDRPIFATVVSVLIVLIGSIAYFTLPVAQYPEIAPPSISVTASYPGATAETAADTVATVLEQQINGVENMLYMKSENTADGVTSLNITFEQGTDLDTAQVLVQNRIAIAEPLLPEEVTRQGINVRKNSPDLMMVIHLLSPDGTRDNLYVSNFAKTQVVDRLARIDGVGEARIVAERAYAMRIWIDPERAQSFNLTANEVITALRQNNAQIAAGVINKQPLTETKGAFELSVETQGRLLNESEFSNIIVKRGENGRVVRLRDLARIELAAQDYNNIGYLDDNLALPVVIFQRPGSNALETAEALRAEMQDIAKQMPPGLEYQIIYDPTQFIAKSIEKIYHTIIEAILLVILVVMLFLQSWRASLIPIVAIPVSLIGTFAVMSALGVSLNNLSLFGLVLAIGIVVDDAIVVVENVERYIREGFSPNEAAHKTMDEVGTALIAIAIVLSAVFIPAAFITGISGAFYQQFALTIATATIISLIVSLTLSPAMAALLLKPHDPDAPPPRGLWGVLGRPVRAFGQGFNRSFDWLGEKYSQLTRRLLRVAALVLIVYLGLIVLTGFSFNKVPTGFIPQQDQGYLINVMQLPPGATLDRTDVAVRDAAERLRAVPGVAHAVQFVGLDGATFTNASNAAVIFTPLDPFEERIAAGLTIDDIQAASQQALSQVPGAMAFAIKPPPVRGMGNAGGWKLYIQDRTGLGAEQLESATQATIGAANQADALSAVFTFYNSATPRIYADVDRTRAEMLNVPVQNVIDTLEIYLGSRYVNDFNFLNRTFRVVAQADGIYRDEQDDIAKLRTRSESGAMVPIGSIATFEEITGPIRVPHYNLYPAIEVQGDTSAGFSSGEAIAAMEQILAETLPDGLGYEWTELALQEKLAGDTAFIAFGLAVVFVFLLLAALYESWLLPLAVILIVPMCLLAAISGVAFRGMDNNILVQIGFIVLIGLASKNAILIVEFAKQAEDRGMSRLDAAVDAARTRLRPILMTSMAFILGVVPLVLATGAGAEMRQALGTAVFSGMLGVTFFGLIFTPVFYVVCRWLAARRETKQTI
ncbi:RND efflux system, inner membrane transporter CmeB [Methylophaga frappieri]|uniref:Efflux pump membrane transporter n=1 Tax=Methylophaga frappieri (strain ATCC BAA-2434 / DSM 25690 / JAM7) TaxID=754477 RepID=I1YHI6_METFJ|nr:multidrug efflux RND transporter permease subunit [Methylophaga frappieri]AFJ02379.1 RND efflux system, inner membrane transporter CmeB [Methylophaga frappieri]